MLFLVKRIIYIINLLIKNLKYEQLYKYTISYYCLLFVKLSSLLVYFKIRLTIYLAQVKYLVIYNAYGQLYKSLNIL